jgi:hypothetical protein
VALHIAIVQAERELIHIAVKMLWAGVVIDAVQAALHNGPNAFDAVRGNIVADILAVAV